MSELAVTVVTEGSMSSTVAVVSAGSLRGRTEVEEIDDEAETDREAKSKRRPRGGRGRACRDAQAGRRPTEKGGHGGSTRPGGQKRTQETTENVAPWASLAFLPAACLGLLS